jgi:outer membrane protein
LSALVGASSVSAQTAPAAPAAAAPPLTQGPAIPGLCLISENQAATASAVGRWVSQRMDQIVTQVKAELGPEDTAIATDGRALEADRKTLDQATFESRAQALQARANALRQKVDQRRQEVEATDRKAVYRIAQELDPIVRQLYQQNHCSVLLDKASTPFFNPANDLTQQAITALNARIQQFSFEREHLDTAAPASR